MALVDSPTSKSIQYSSRTVERAKRAIGCVPFHMDLFAIMAHQSVSLNAIAGEAGVQNRYTQKPLSELAAESALLWLIQVGVLRREVDGQGITDSFRLTPLGRQLVKVWQHQRQSWSNPSFFDHLYNALNRWLRLSL